MSNQVNCQDNSNGNGLQQGQSNVNVEIVQYETTSPLLWQYNKPLWYWVK